MSEALQEKLNRRNREVLSLRRETEEVQQLVAEVREAVAVVNQKLKALGSHRRLTTRLRLRDAA